MKIKFSKYHGCGNDFICINATSLSVDLVALAKVLCQRRFSVGADGIVVYLNSNIADFKMKIINSDGSIPEMCGNGLRCLTAFAANTSLIDTTEFKVETDTIVHRVKVLDTNKSYSNILVEMGPAKFKDKLSRNNFNFDTSKALIDIDIDDNKFQFMPVSMGNPHAVIIVDDVDAINIANIGPKVENHSLFPNRVNIEFVQIVSSSEIKVRVWERGVGETSACGTGACAAAVASFLLDYCDKDVNVQLEGGHLKVKYKPDSKQVYMTGPAKFVFDSEIEWLE